MSQYIIRRVLLMIPTLLGVSLLITALLKLLPGDAVDVLVADNAVAGGSAAFKQIVDERMVAAGLDPVQAGFGDRIKFENDLLEPQLRRDGLDPAKATDAQKQAARNTIALNAYKEGIRRKLGVDKNVVEQWWSWTTSALRGDLGTSIFGNVSVSAELKRRIPASVELGALAMLVSLLVALPVGVLSAVRRDTFLDYSTRSFAIAMLALPSFFVATLVIAFASSLFGYSFPIFYKDLWVDPGANVQLVIAPAVILGFGLSGTLMRLTRAQMLEVLRQDYMRTARAKGLKEHTAIVRHAVRNAFIPVVTVIGLQAPVLIGGSLVLEQIFGIPGVARYLFESIAKRDFPPIIGVNMVVALTIIATNLVVDVAYAYLDPRIRFA
ncbi:MAG: ABC transporter permease [Dehalococcoidia bacterium]